MEPLYKFTLNEETGKINVQEITKYEEGKWSDRKRYWRYRGKSCWMYVYENKLDKFLSGSVYSFNSDINHAKKIMLDSVIARKNKAYKEHNRWFNVWQFLR